MERVLLLHGVPTAGALWDGVKRALGPDLELVAPDLPGFGGTTALAHPRPEAFVEALLPLINHQTHLVGHDYGGLLAAMIASRRPVRSLVLSSTALGLGWLPARLTALPPLNRLFYRRYAGRRWLELGVSEPLREALLLAFPGADPREMEALARRLPLWRGHRLRPKLPTLCLWGAEDRSVPVWYARLLAARLGARLETLPGLRHYAMWEAPRAYAEALRRFWAQIP